MMNRRQFTGHLAGGAMLAFAGASMFTLEGCNALDELQAWVPVGLQAFDGIAAFVDGPFTTIAATTDALWAAVQAAIARYNDPNNPDPKNTKLDKVIATLDALSSGLADALAALPISIPAAALNAAKLGLALVIATLKAIRNKLQPAPTPPAVTAAIGSTAPAKDRDDFVNRFNAIMQQNGQSLRVA